MQKLDSIYGGTSFWMLNDRLDDDELVTQIREMHDKGIYAFIARTYIGLKSDYPGEQFMGKIKLIIETAQQYGIKVLLQARYMPEAIPDLEPEAALDFLTAVNGDSLDENYQKLSSAEGITCAKFCSGTFLNMFDGNAVDRYIEICYGMWDRFKEHFGKTVISIWVDEPSYSGDYLPYPKGLENEFKNRFGYDLRDKLHLLFCDKEGYQTVRWQYRTILQDMMENAYFYKIQQWCNKNGLWFSGHLMCEDTMRSQLLRACAAMPYYAYFDLPGMDYLLTQLNWNQGEIKPSDNRTHGSRPVSVLTCLQLASASAQADKKDILCEMYGVSSQGLSFRDQKHIFDIFACHGINHRAIHGSFYSLAGRRKRAYPPHINYYQPYWSKFGELTDCVKRTAQFVSQGVRAPRVLVMHPLGTAGALFPAQIQGEERAQSDRLVEQLDGKLHDLLSRMIGAHIQFDLGDERILERDGAIKSDSIVIGKKEYDTVVVPYMSHLRSSTNELLSKFKASGGRVLVLDNEPCFVDGVISKTEFKVTHTNTSALIEQLKALNGFRIVGTNSHNLRVLRLTDEGCDRYFILNYDCSMNADVELTVKSQTSATLTDCMSGSQSSIPCSFDGSDTTVSLHLEVGESLMLTLTQGKSTALPSPIKATKVVPLAHRWGITRDTDNVILLEMCRYRKGNERFSEPVPVLAVQDILVREDYRGPLTLKYEFESAVALYGAKLALEEAKQWQIAFNGQTLDNTPQGRYIAKSFETVKLPKIQVGKNTVEITRDYVPLTRAKKSINSLFEYQRGDELECCYIIGDFAVNAEAEPCLTDNVRYSGFVIDNENAVVGDELTACGYPFYAGKATLSQNVSLDLNGASRILLKLNGVFGAYADISVNKKDCGLMMWAPYTVDITDAVFDGENEISITVAGTLRNLLGPYHRPQGEVGNLFGGSYINPNLAWNGTDKAISDPEWYEHRVPGTPLWCESYMQTRFGVWNAKVVIEY